MLFYAHQLGLVAAALLQSSDVARVEQISAGKPVVPIVAPPPTGAAPSQLTPVSQSKFPARQVSDGIRSATPSQQLAPRQKSAQAGASLSKPADGRPTPTERIEGADRCDPKLRSEQARTKCSRVIENRAAEFKRNEAPELSPEQKISLEQSGVDTTGIDAATRQLATTGNASGSMDAQGVAAIVLRPPAEDSRKKEPELDPNQSEAAAAITGLLNQAPPQ